MPVPRRALTLLGVIFVSGSALGGTATHDFGGARSDRVQMLPGRPVPRTPALAPVVVGPAPRVLPSSRLTCLSKQVRVCDTSNCGPNGCPYSCHFEARCIPYGRTPVNVFRRPGS